MERHTSLDWLRSIAIIFVVLIHMASKYTMRETPLSTPWLVCLAIESIARVGLVSFFILSGFLLIRKFDGAKDIAGFYARRAKRLLPLFLFWSFIYYVLQAPSFNLEDFFKGLLAGSIRPHLWFVYYLGGMYATMPYISNLLASAKKSDLVVFCLVCSLSYTFFSVFNWLHIIPTYMLVLPSSVWSCYLIAGYVLKRLCESGLSASLGACIFVYLLSTTAVFFISFLTSNASRPVVELFDPQPYSDNICMLIAASAFFIIFWKFFIFPIPGLMKFVSDRSYGIYLSHMMFIDCYNKYLTIKPWFIDLVCMFVFTMAGALLLELALSRLKFADWINFVLVGMRK